MASTQWSSMGFKRARNVDDDGDDTSIGSRPSSPLDSMQVDDNDVYKYDEYVRGYEKEAVTVDTKIPSSNKGFGMLMKLGWVEGQGLGVTGDGRVDPIPFHVKQDMTGLGKYGQDARMIETTVSQRRELASERFLKESDDQRAEREDSVARRAYIQSEVTETLRPFYCAVCEKQFQNVAQYDEHCNSYAHHHKIRFKEMQSSERAKANSQEVVEKRREKERKREDKELRKAAKAAGVKLTTITPVVSMVGTTQNAVVTTPTPGIEPAPAPLEKKSGFTSGGWSTVSSSSSGGGFKKSGWTAVSSSLKPPSPHPPPPPEPPHVTPIPPPPTASTPGFRSGGWTTLEGPPSASTPNRPLTPNVYHSTPPQHPNPPPLEPIPIPSLPEPSTSGLKPIPIVGNPTYIQPQPTPQPVRNSSVSKRAEASRSGWQNFSRGGSRR
ncbi:hypothetical protein BDM02DRAFT_3120922 [Thelephora ganbajun]|uniref:Uncharacterized protein n=1 Tax=Thelephora ganbajun TaxID=370292 RepID=A0ACB6Z648_THEGA|nr:hypothetical protein BDM02DRAFT_3120922 [Thelephora ganbajun]